MFLKQSPFFLPSLQHFVPDTFLSSAFLFPIFSPDTWVLGYFPRCWFFESFLKRRSRHVKKWYSRSWRFRIFDWITSMQPIPLLRCFVFSFSFSFSNFLLPTSPSRISSSDRDYSTYALFFHLNRHKMSASSVSLTGFFFPSPLSFLFWFARRFFSSFLFFNLSYDFSFDPVFSKPDLIVLKSFWRSSFIPSFSFVFSFFSLTPIWFSSLSFFRRHFLIAFFLRRRFFRHLSSWWSFRSWSSPFPSLLPSFSVYPFLPSFHKADFFLSSFGSLFLSLALPSIRSSIGKLFALHFHFSPLFRSFFSFSRSSSPSSFSYHHATPFIFNITTAYDSMLLNENNYIAHSYRNLIPKRDFFVSHFVHKKTKWLSIMKFKRFTYLGGYREMSRWYKNNKQYINFRPYNRDKHPNFYKNNKLFYWYSKLLKNWRYNYVLDKKKHLRIGQILKKIIFPFYGHWRLKQFNKFFKRVQLVKSLRKSREENLMTKLEYRLDVMAYRLNLAPTLSWARDFVRNGGIYLYEINSNWNETHGDLMYIAYPLKLRDPKFVYSNNVNKKKWINNYYVFKDVFNKIKKWNWLFKWNWFHLKYFNVPITNPDYRAKVGDVVQASPYFLQQYLKLNLELLRKPIPAHLYTAFDGRWYWSFYKKFYRYQATAKWQKQTLSYVTAVVLTNPKWRNIKKDDRINSNNYKFICLS